MPPNVESSGESTEVTKMVKTKVPMEMVQLLVEQGMTEVPQKWVQPESVRLQPTAKLPENRQVPSIDLSTLAGDDKGDVKAAIAKAFKEWGFLQVTNHGVPLELMDDLMRVMHEFFALSPEEKEVNAIKPGDTTGYGRLFEKTGTVANWVDRCTICSYGEELMLADPCMPPKPERTREVVTTYGRAVVKLCIRILEVLSESLGLEPHVIGERLNVHRMGLRTSFNYYPKCPQPELVFGVMPHADSSIITVLHQDMTPGLEVLKDGVWVPIPPTKDALVLNIGDQMQIVSNGTYKSVMHRAMANNTVGRYSVPNFFVPTKDTVLEPLKELISETNPPVYRSMTFEEYTKGFFTKPLSGVRHIDQFKIIK